MRAGTRRFDIGYDCIGGERRTHGVTRLVILRRDGGPLELTIQDETGAVQLREVDESDPLWNHCEAGNEIPESDD